MKKIKKVLALLVAMVMVMGMTMTTMAAPANATITVKDENEKLLKDVKLSFVPVIVADTSTRTGWAFTSEIIERAYLDAFNETDNQKVIDQLIAYKAEKEGAATSEEIAKALSNVANSEQIEYLPMENPQPVTEAGVYAVKAEQEGYTYNNMAAYVGFGPVEDQNYPTLTSTDLIVKRTPTNVDKSTTDPDKVVAIGDIVTYTIKTKVPYIDPNHANKTFKITDTIAGAEYYLTGEGSTATVQMGTDTVVGGAERFVVSGNNFTVDLSDLITSDNANAGKDVIVTYTAKVTEVTVNNQAGGHISGEEVDSHPSVDVYTGQITLTKTDEETGKLLAGAGFEVRKDDVNGTPLTFSEENEGIYIYDPEGKETTVFTGQNGTLVLKGLDVGIYYFKETVAPEGYHIADSPKGYDAQAKIVAPKSGVTEIIKAETELTNTKLSSLPSTGGIGTTIFTIGGCVIMIAAAGLFFASRRKENK